MKITIVKERPSNGAVALRDALRALGHTVRFTKEYPNKIIWGKPTNKKMQLQAFSVEGVPCVEWTLDPSVAVEWPVTYERHKLSGHSGEGIVVSLGGDILPPPHAPLYTKGITGKRREYRVHIIGDAAHVQQKRRRNGFHDYEYASDDVRNHSTGWVYATQGMTPPPESTVTLARGAVRALGLTYGAVDLIVPKGQEPLVLEVNTAPGLEGRTLQFYVDNFESLLEVQQ